MILRSSFKDVESQTIDIAQILSVQALSAGHEVTVLNRGSMTDTLPASVRSIIADFQNDAEYAQAAAGTWDVVCQFITFEPEEAERDAILFAGRTGQYVFISTASAYAKPVTQFPITEAVPLDNPYWEYSRKKIACEQVLRQADDLPLTIVRPSHTIRTRFPTAIGEGDALLSRLLRGLPIVVPGDGRALWTLTRAEDFAPPFVRLFGNRAAIGEAFHLTSDCGFPWDMIYAAVGLAIGAEPHLVHVPTDNLVYFHPDWEGFLKGDRAHTLLFDNTKIKSVVGDFSCEGDLDALMRSPLEHWLANGGAATTRPSAELDSLLDRIIALQAHVMP